MCTIYDRDDGYPSNFKKALRTAQTLINDDNTAVCEFQGLEPGDYALSTFHDENDNKKLDSNWIGIPNEGVGASNNAKGFMGPPKFKDAKVPYDGGRKVYGVKIQYL